jgi:hypothetical protein
MLMFKHRGLRTRGPMLRTAPVEGSPGGADPTAGGGGSPTPAAPPAPGADPLKDPAVVAAIAKATADAEAKARLGTKENGKKEALEELKNALGPILGIKPAEVDPAKLGSELAESKAMIARLTTQIAVSDAARTAGGDAEMVTAWLSHKGLLKDLDPAGADFATKVGDLVKAQIEANPKLKAGDAPPAAPVVTPGRQGAASTSTAGGAQDTARPSMAQAIQAQMAGLRK